MKKNPKNDMYKDDDAYIYADKSGDNEVIYLSIILLSILIIFILGVK